KQTGPAAGAKRPQPARSHAPPRRQAGPPRRLRRVAEITGMRVLALTAARVGLGIGRGAALARGLGRPPDFLPPRHQPAFPGPLLRGLRVRHGKPSFRGRRRTTTAFPVPNSGGYEKLTVTAVRHTILRARRPTS